MARTVQPGFAAALALAGSVAAWPAGSQAQPADHLECFRATDERAKVFGEYALDVAPRLVPPFASEAGCRLKAKARRLCIDAAVSGVAPSPPGAPPGAAPGQIYLCYAMRCARAQPVVIDLVDRFGAGAIVARGRRARRELCVPAAPSTATTTTIGTTTTTTTLFACSGNVALDPDGVVGALPVGVPTSVPVSASDVTGILDVFLDDGGVGGTVLCPPTGCLMGITGSTTVDFTYTAPTGAPPSITLTARLTPHSVGFTCGPGSGGSTSSRTYPVP